MVKVERDPPVDCALPLLAVSYGDCTIHVSGNICPVGRKSQDPHFLVLFFVSYTELINVCMR